MIWRPLWFGCLVAVVSTGCATTGTEKPVPIGDNTYMIGRLGGMTDFSGSAVKAELIREASEFCASRSSGMKLLDSTAKDSAPFVHASAEVQFRCEGPPS